MHEKSGIGSLFCFIFRVIGSVGIQTTIGNINRKIYSNGLSVVIEKKPNGKGIQIRPEMSGEWMEAKKEKAPGDFPRCFFCFSGVIFLKSKELFAAWIWIKFPN